MTTESTRILRLDVGSTCLGLPVDRVREVVEPGRLSPVPLAPAGVAGLLALRGRVLPALDLAARFGLESAGGERVGVLVETGRGPVFLLGDRVHGLVALPDAGLGPAPGAVPAALRAAARGAWRGTGGWVVVLEPDRTLP